MFINIHNLAIKYNGGNIMRFLDLGNGEYLISGDNLMLMGIGCELVT
jgi:hypothetical protein